MHNYEPITTKIDIRQHAGDNSNSTEFGYDRSNRDLPTEVWNITRLCVFIFFPWLGLAFLFLRSSTAWTAQPILTIEGSNDSVRRKDVPFDGLSNYKLYLGGENPQKLPPKPPDAENPAKLSNSKNGCNFWTNWPIFMKFEISVAFVKPNPILISKF